MTLTDQTWSCAAAETRTVWDGDHIAEVRWPWGSQQDTGPMEEAETMHPRQMGRVLYTQGLNLDKPLLLARIDYDSFFPGTNAIIPHTNWLGHYDSGTFVTQGNATGPACMKRARLGQDATKYPFEDPDVTGGLNQDSITICYDVEWPAPYLWNSKRPIDRGKYGPPSWMGSLVEGGRDASGQMYMRNRYYDPSTGRFTQEDPIGLAGGINLYGYAGGDAVNYSDPYGLYDEEKSKAKAAKKKPPLDVLGALVMLGGSVSGKLNSEFERSLFRRYWTGGGAEYRLSSQRFAHIVSEMERLGPDAILSSRPIIGEGGTQMGVVKAVSFYGSPEYDYSLGSAYIIFDKGGKAIGLHDTYNFERAGRNPLAEIATVATRAAAEVEAVVGIYNPKPYVITCCY
jgi:RHS repeat-associated protein